jgi:hypothetical protein
MVRKVASLSSVAPAVVENLKARMKIHDAWTNLVLADEYLAQGSYQEAGGTLHDTERLLRIAQSVITMEKSGSAWDKLTDIRNQNGSGPFCDDSSHLH